ncbi:hypothetical protein C3747_97g742c [Trypanosoma cruzi]|uniref:Uncharacterized protein n=2 Tax=Trypanosoma cruzi TaxID=5693 RepID=Q4DAQ2_TRYCC|nr:hypothetical protein, conserved [Trypanosoma cruzi]EAN89609.1 hypothetical protein, conserved [Trypanosoma cruzi]KAF8296855.1 hypothetical protein TcYC6_0087020 [Trypanosoma cruzi]PWV07811.1 hypothetical protein C3747_97g742c [Trypanosoma cruzi]RNC44630.1 hypothetical protein TcCL_NonESM05649 [Trypanosoma cruzi]|eukprot:XP_811460.1 hypothetical protein [Trypanosoma cruzi strain CL Brener]
MWRGLTLRISRRGALLVSKKNLRLKCGACRRLLPAAHFNNTTAPSQSLVCVDCKRLCILCGLHLTVDRFTDASAELCDNCLAKRHVARENVYFRYPVLKYRACPFSVDQMREEIRREEGPRR